MGRNRVGENPVKVEPARECVLVAFIAHLQKYGNPMSFKVKLGYRRHVGTSQAFHYDAMAIGRDSRVIALIRAEGRRVSINWSRTV